MFDIEFRFVTIFGLIGFLGAWFIVWTAVVVVRGAILRGAEETDAVSDAERKAFKKFQRLWGTLLLPGCVLIVLGWLFIMVWAGWRARTTADEPQGVLEGPPQGTLDFTPSPNSPSVAGERVKEEGRELQKEGLEELGDWRQDFFDIRDLFLQFRIHLTKHRHDSA